MAGVTAASALGSVPISTVRYAGADGTSPLTPSPDRQAAGLEALTPRLPWLYMPNTAQNQEDMGMEGLRGVIVTGSVVALMATVVAAEAVEVRVRCDYRAGARERTKVSVDGKDLVGGDYQASVDGVPSPVFTVTPPADEFEAGFDSIPANIRAGATAIPASAGRHGVSVVVVGPDVSFSQTVPCPGQATQVAP